MDFSPDTLLIDQVPGLRSMLWGEVESVERRHTQRFLSALIGAGLGAGIAALAIADNSDKYDPSSYRTGPAIALGAGIGLLVGASVPAVSVWECIPIRR